MKKVLLLLVSLFLFSPLLSGQSPCATELIQQWREQTDSNFSHQHGVHQQKVNRYRMEQLLSNDFWNQYHLENDSPSGGEQPQGLIGGSGSGCRNARYVIPVVIHIVHHPSHTTPGTGSNISNAQVENQLNALNDAFANMNGGPNSIDTKIQFCLATNVSGGTGIRRHSDLASHHYIHQYDSLFALYNEDETRYLNIYVVSDFRDSSGSVTSVSGYGLYPFEPGRHGVTVRYTKFGNAADTCTSCPLDTSSRGKILVHEVGHYLGLYHPFNKSCVGIDSSDCHKKGDLCCDVPQANQEYYDCNSRNTCTETYDGNLGDMTENYMGYARESCINTFTPDQVSIMHAILEGRRMGLITPENQELAEMECCLFTANFVADNVFLCGADSVRFSAIKYEGAAYTWRVVRNAVTSIYTDTIGRLSVYLSDTGYYHISLTVFIGSDSQRVERFQYIELKNCGSPLASSQGNWYFGDLAGLTFSSNGVVKNFAAFDGNPDPTISTYQGCITHSNEFGELLFYGGGGPFENVYVDSFFLYNKDHQKMLNSAVYGDGSSESGGIVVPFPGNGARFYLFTTSTNNTNYRNGIHYHVIDTTLDNGRGGVVPGMKNLPMPPPIGADSNYTDGAFIGIEGITAIPMCSTPGYWLITVDNGDFSPMFDHFVIYSVDTNGVTVNTVSNASAFVTRVPAQLKASPDGTMVSFQGEVFSFDRVIGDMQLIYQNGIFAVGTSFSPNSKVVYFLEEIDQSSSNLYQLDLEDPNDSSARKLVAHFDDIAGYNHLQLGPDGKIYMANFEMDQLGVIEYPDSVNSNLTPNKCGFTLNGPKLKNGSIGGESKWGLPNMVDAKLLVNIPVTISAMIRGCDSVFFTSTEICSATNFWNFGDGNTSTLAQPTHVYLTDSVYQVVLVSDRGSDTLLIKIGLDEPIITGDTIACDTSGFISYSILNELDNVNYAWSVTGGTLFYPPGVPNTVSVKWDSNGSLDVTAYNPKTGCSRAGQREITIASVTSNSITANQVLCPSTAPDELQGSLPTVNLPFAYQWQSKTPSGSWQALINGDSQDYQPPLLANDSVYYRRVIEVGPCDFPSNEILVISTILRNTISITGTPCIGSSPFTIFGDTAISSAGGVSYGWQYSPDSITWYDMGASDTLLNLTVTNQDSVRWYRRKAITTACTAYSNEIRITPNPVILKDLTSVAICGPGPETHSFLLELANPTGDIQLEFNHYREISSGNWAWTTGSLVNYPDSFMTSVNDGDSVKIRILRSGCELYSQTVPITRVTLLPDTSNPTSPDPFNMTVTQDYININLGTQTVITASLHNAHTWLQSAGNGDEFFQWQKCQTLIYGGYTPWEDIPGANNDTLFLSGVYCDRGNYRVILRGFWAQTNSCIDFIPPDFASLSMTETIWSKDGVADTAAEPNVDPNRDYWNSPHLWNCWKSMNCSTHESPEYMNTDSNQVRTTILNTGPNGSGPFRVFLYWCLGGFYEKWPVSWHLDLVNNGFYNPNYGQTYPMGSEIDSIDISGMPGGTSITVSAKWKPPYPGWYDTSSYYNGEQVKHPLCILSRIVTCDEDPYGMTINEIEPTGDNVINNNNIVTRNTEVCDSIGWNKKTPVYPLRMGNQRDTTRKIRLVLDNAVSNYWDLGYLTLRLAPNLMDAWVSGGSVGSGYSLAGDEFKIGADGFYLDNISLDGDEWGWAYFQFKLHPGKSITVDRGQQLFRLVQLSGDNVDDPDYVPDGGFNFLLNLLSPIEEEGMSIPEPDRKYKEAKGQNAEVFWYQEAGNEGSAEPAKAVITTTSVIAYPNPSSDMVFFGLTLETERTVGIEIFNSLGASVGEIRTKTYPEGKHKVSFDAGRLAPGTYLAKVNVNGEIKLISLVIVR